MSKFKLAATAALLPLAAFALSSSIAVAAPGAKGAEQVRVIVAYKDGQRGNAERALAMAGAETHYDLFAQRSFAVSLPAVAVEGLSHNPAIEYVEADVKRYPLGVDLDGGDEQPYGVAAVQAEETPFISGTISGESDTGAGNVTVCIIDSGIDRDHPDLAGNRLNGYLDSGTGDWSEDENHHGTHVAGTIAALNNGSGVVGVAPNGRLNLFIVKVFGADGWAYSSTLTHALNQCQLGRVANTKLVVSMSLGGSIKSRTEETAFANAYSAGVLSIAAAGNDGNSRVSYPAGYASVVSVAAVDSNNTVATFSQYNSDVEIAAPGVGVLSTVPVGTGSSTSFSVGGTLYAAEAMDGSPKGMVESATLVDCGIGDAKCSAAADGKVCLIQRGTVDFATKVQNCQAGGGGAAVIYNNVDGMLYGTLGTTVTEIPSIGISKADGESLRATQLGKAAAVAVTASNYAYFDGTSMATPHVSGVAAIVWGQKSTCSNAQIRSALTLSAKDLGAAGRDVYYGYGLVQARQALAKLGENCGGTSGGGGTKPGKGK